MGRNTVRLVLTIAIRSKHYRFAVLKPLQLRLLNTSLSMVCSCSMPTYAHSLNGLPLVLSLRDEGQGTFEKLGIKRSLRPRMEEEESAPKIAAVPPSFLPSKEDDSRKQPRLVDGSYLLQCRKRIRVKRIQRLAAESSHSSCPLQGKKGIKVNK
eukprot:1149169-Pelagomonas_calceolata.AAC.5